MKEKILKRLTKSEVRDSDPRPRNRKLEDAIGDNLELDIRQIRLVDDSDNWRGWIVSYEEGGG
jgi:hypothetical protein